MAKEICGNCSKFTNLFSCETHKHLKVSYHTPACKEDFSPVWESLPPYAQKIEEQIQVIKGSLDRLIANPDETLWFGDKENPGSLRSTGAGIRYVKTAGGMQFRLFSVDIFGRKHSSDYVFGREELIEKAIIRIGIYLRPTRFSTPIGKSQPLPFLSWFIHENPVREESKFPPVEDILSTPLLKDCVTITLDAPE